LAASAFAPGQRRLVLRQPFVKLGARFPIRREDHFAAIGIHQHFVAVTNALQNTRKVSDRGKAFLAGEQCRMRALPERLHDDGRDGAPRQRYDIGRQKVLEHEYAAGREVLHSVGVFTFKVAQDFASEVGKVVGSLLERFACQRVKLLLPPAKDAPHHCLCIHQRSL